MPGTLCYCDEARQFIEKIQNPTTRKLVNMAFVHLLKQVHLGKREQPRRDLDMLFLVVSLKDFFSAAEVISQTLEGEKVGDR